MALFIFKVVRLPRMISFYPLGRMEAMKFRLKVILDGVAFSTRLISSEVSRIKGHVFRDLYGKK